MPSARASSEIPGIRKPGVSFYGIEEPVGEPCEVCGQRPGQRQKCILDGAHHRHGMTHWPGPSFNELKWVCNSCLDDGIAIAEAHFRRMREERKHTPT